MDVTVKVEIEVVVTVVGARTVEVTVAVWVAVAVTVVGGTVRVTVESTVGDEGIVTVTLPAWRVMVSVPPWDGVGIKRMKAMDAVPATTNIMIANAATWFVRPLRLASFICTASVPLAGHS